MDRADKSPCYYDASVLGEEVGKGQRINKTNE